MSIQNGLYHKDVFFPSEFNLLTGQTFFIRLTNHARKACLDDRYGYFLPPAKVVIEAGQVIEVEITAGKCSKVVVRQSLDKNRDIIIVFIPEGSTAVCKTLWINMKTDSHKTLDRSRYVQPPKKI